MESRIDQSEDWIKSLLSLTFIICIGHFIFTKYKSHFFSTINFSQSKLKNQIHIGIITHSYSNLKPSYIMDNWVKSFLKIEESDGVHFISDKLVNVTPSIQTVIYNATKYLDATLSFQMLKKLIISLEYFLKHSDAPWYFRLNENVHIYTDNIYNFLLDINSHYNPYFESIVIGNCVGNNEAFLSGRIGYFISRYAAQSIVLNQNLLLNKNGESDDQIFSRFITQKLGISLVDATSNYFMGFLGTDEQIDLLLKNDISHFPACPTLQSINSYKDLNSQCRFFLSRLNSIVAYHGLPYNKSQYTFPRLILRNIPMNLYWYQEKFYSVICHI